MRLVYQPTTKHYVEILEQANAGKNDRGAKLRATWEATGKAASFRDRADVSFEDHARFVYHAGMERVLLVSGRPNRGVFSGDGRDWSHVADANSCLFMQGGAYDEAHDRVVVLMTVT
ncbi:hypothetical protein WMF37_19410 [Sorangium sp. So ce291]|uniref:hypothetical protein n=1 Tax=Sorangium sp. So ce291 TaxID=3133294 RepID=UPI003F61CCBF